MFCDWAGAFSLPTSSNQFSISGGGLCGSCTPNVGGTHTAPDSCFGFCNRKGVAKNRGLVVVNSRKVVHGPSAGTLPVCLLIRRLLERTKYRDVCHRAIVQSCLSSEVSLDHHDLVSFLHGHLQGLQL